jgi:predicted Zn-dependent peptidase
VRRRTLKDSLTVAAGRADGWTVRAVTVLLLLSAGPSVLSAQGFPTTPPKPTPLTPVRFPPFKEAALANGLQLVVIEHHEQPVVSVTLSFRAGGIYDPPGKEGLSTLAAELLSKGTDSRSAEQIAATIEGVGGTLSASSGDDFLTISGDALSDQAGLVFDLLGDVTLHSTFSEGELELARTRALSALALQLSQPSAVAQRFFGSEIYGRNPYGRSSTRESYRAVTRDDVTQFARQHLRPAGAVLVVAGDVTDAQVRELAAKAFEGWRGAPPASPALPTPATRVATDILVVHRPGSTQANIVAGNTTIFPTDPGYYAARVATQVLGGGADSRLFLILREQKSWTYGAYASLHRYRGLGYWQATAEVRTEVADSALRELLHQIDRVRTEVIPDSELVATKGFLVGSFPLTIETPRQIATQVASVKLLGLGDEYLRLYRERLAAVTALQARAAAARLYRRGALTIVVVGDGAKLYDRLAAIAPTRMVDVDGKPLALADLNPPTGTVALDPAQFAAHTDSSRVLIQGNPVGFTVSEIRRPPPDSLVYVERSNLGSAFQQQTTLVLEPTSGSVRQLDQVTTQQGQKAETHLTYAGGRVKGTSSAPQPDGSVKRFEVDTALPPGTVDENAVPFVVPALSLAPGKAFAMTFFTPSENVVRVLTFKVGAPEAVVVPAGTFQGFRIDVAGSRVPFTMYVSTDAPRRVLKTEFVGQPFVVELVK